MRLSAWLSSWLSACEAELSKRIRDAEARGEAAARERDDLRRRLYATAAEAEALRDELDHGRRERDKLTRA